MLARLLFALALTAIASVASVRAAVDADLVKYLPGYGALPVKHYSGFLDAAKDGSTKLHYWFVESQNAPSTDPIVLWLNGGPGCSSLDGFLSEHGPLHFNGSRDASGVPLLYDNPYSWNLVANMIYLESPAGVGFSYYMNGSYAYTDDAISSWNNYNALLDFFGKFPEYSKNDFYITGESYAGIYVPTLVDRIRINAPNMPLKGFAVGNGCWGNAEGTCDFDPSRNIEQYTLGLYYSAQFFSGHGWIKPTDWTQITVLCGNFTHINPSQSCINALQNFPIVPQGSFNVYDIYDWCPSPVSSAQQVLRAPTAKGEQWRQQILQAASNDRKAVGEHRHQRKHQRPGPKQLLPVSGVEFQPPCVNIDVTNDWLNNPTVQSALHVTQANATWTMCNFVVNGNYNRSTDSLLGLYPTLIQKYRTLIYSGDADSCVPHVGTERWVRSLGYTPVEAWYPWTIRNEQVAGYSVKFSTNFVFATVKGAGHMVPQVMPESAFNMFSRWLAGKDL